MIMDVYMYICGAINLIGHFQCHNRQLENMSSMISVPRFAPSVVDAYHAMVTLESPDDFFVAGFADAEDRSLLTLVAKARFLLHFPYFCSSCISHRIPTTSLSDLAKCFF